MYTVETKQLSATTRSLDALWEVATSFDLPSVSGDLAKDTRVLLGKEEDVSLTSLAVEPTVIVYDSSTSIAMYEMHEAMLVASFAWSSGSPRARIQEKMAYEYISQS